MIWKTLTHSTCTHASTRVKNCVPVPMISRIRTCNHVTLTWSHAGPLPGPMDLYPYSYPHQWSCTCGLVPIPFYTNGLSTGTHDPYLYYKSDTLIESQCVGHMHKILCKWVEGARHWAQVKMHYRICANRLINESSNPLKRNTASLWRAPVAMGKEYSDLIFMKKLYSGLQS